MIENYTRKKNVAETELFSRITAKIPVHRDNMSDTDHWCVYYR